MKKEIEDGGGAVGELKNDDTMTSGTESESKWFFLIVKNMYEHVHIESIKIKNNKYISLKTLRDLKLI